MIDQKFHLSIPFCSSCTKAHSNKTHPDICRVRPFKPLISVVSILLSHMKLLGLLHRLPKPLNTILPEALLHRLQENILGLVFQTCDLQILTFEYLLFICRAIEGLILTLKGLQRIKSLLMESTEQHGSLSRSGSRQWTKNRADAQSMTESQSSNNRCNDEVEGLIPVDSGFLRDCSSWKAWER